MQWILDTLKDSMTDASSIVIGIFVVLLILMFCFLIWYACHQKHKHELQEKERQSHMVDIRTIPVGVVIQSPPISTNV
jgi:TRAP-type C4-dicarboxylate transport system permease small subunit